MTLAPPRGLVVPGGVVNSSGSSEGNSGSSKLGSVGAKKTGSYTNTHESDKTYSGKGTPKRAQESANRIAKVNKDPVKKLIIREREILGRPSKQRIKESKKMEARIAPKIIIKLILLVESIMNRTKRNLYKMSKDEIFWDWFKVNNSKYYYLNQIVDLEEKEELLDAFLKQLHLYCDQLFFEIGGFPNAPQELIISAEGDKNYFPKVEELVLNAPKINDWQIIAFKPPMGIDFITEYEDIKLNPKEIWFLPLDNESEPEKLGLRLYLPNYKSRKQQTFLEGCYQVLDVILGEKSCALDVSHLEVDKLPTNPEKADLIELSELAKYIEWRKAKM